MKRLIDTITRFATAGDASGGSCNGNPALPANEPFNIHGRPAVRFVKGEGADADFIEVFVLGDESSRTNIYQGEATPAGTFNSQWWKITANDAADLKDATEITFIQQSASFASSGAHYPRSVKTGSHTLQGAATAGTSSISEHIFQLSGRGSSICYKQLS
jgi:hypothetical protein